MNSTLGKAPKHWSSGSLSWGLQIVMGVGDYIAVLLSEWAALSLRNLCMTYSVYHISAVYFYGIVPFIFLMFLFLNRLYSGKLLFYQAVEKLFYACLYSILFAVVLLFVGKVSEEVSRLYVGLLAILSFCFLVGMRYVLKQTLGKMTLLRTPVLIVGAGLTADVVVREFRKDSGLNYEVIGFLEDHEPKTEYVSKYPILGGFADLEKVVNETGVQHVLIAAPGLPQEQLAGLLYRAQSICSDVGVVPNLVEVPMSNVQAESYYDARIMILHVQNNLSKWTNRAVKRIFDVVMTIVGGLLISPILLGVAFWVYRDSPGPVIYKHRRVGKDGKEFDCYKFRSMCVDSAERLQKLLESDPEARKEWETSFKLKNDPRITRSGAFLRKTSLDELPQLLNVLKGEMSLVGPRPIVQKEVPRYGEYIKEYYMVRPGITGMWQVSGRSDIDYPERVQMDSWYVHNWSVWLDILMLWRTIKVVAGRKGAY